jgi:hypothetical protein
MQQADHQEHREPCAWQVTQRGRGGESEGEAEQEPQGTQPIGQAADGGPADQPYRCAGTENQADLFGRETARRQEGGQKRRSHAERRVYEAEQKDEAPQRGDGERGEHGLTTPCLPLAIGRRAGSP